MAVVTVEEVSGRPSFKRFVELPYAQFRTEPRWSPPVVAYERSRLDPQRSPYFTDGDGEYFLARRAGVVAGRIAAHVAAADDVHGRFGFFDAIDDAAVVAALVEQAAEWLRARGCTTMTGPMSFTEDDGPGVLVEGFAVAGTTGRPWHPPWYAAHLEAAGLTETTRSHRWRLDPRESAAITVGITPAADASSHRWAASAGRFADPRLVLDDVVAVPDLTAARGSALTLARRARRRDWDGCTIVWHDGVATSAVPRLCRAAGDAGYAWVVAPWSPDDALPETAHARWSMSL